MTTIIKRHINALDPKSFKERFEGIDPKVKKAIQKAIDKELNKLTPKQEKEIKTLFKKALSLFKQVVIKRAGKRCEARDEKGNRCKKTKRLNVHHVESYATNKGFRCNPRNGCAFCSTHHKFGRESAHHSFVFMWLFMTQYRQDDLNYLQEHYRDRIVITKEFLEEIIRSLSEELNEN